MTMTTMTMRDSDIIEYIEGVEDEIRRLRAKITAVVEGLGDAQRRRVEAWMSSLWVRCEPVRR
jgi:hypothetical protein